MRSVKSANSLNQIQNHASNRQHQQLHEHNHDNQQHHQQHHQNNAEHQQNGSSHHQNFQNNQNDRNNKQSNDQKSSNYNNTTSPICRCRVMYLGSSVPHITKDGLQGIQEPLNVLYPDKASLSSGNGGIDSWLSVWSNGILIENVDESGKEVKKFFKIEALHYCAAVKFVPLALQGNYHNPYTTLPSASSLAQMPQFLPLDSPQARQPNPSPPIFASIMRRTTGIKVLECHAFICKREAAANALVRCCFHAYADTTYAKQIGADIDEVSTDSNNNQNSRRNHNSLESQTSMSDVKSQPSNINGNIRRAKSIGNFNEQESRKTVKSSSDQDGNLIRPKSINGSIHNDNDDDNSNYNNLWNQQRFSKSLHHLNDLNERMIQQINQQSYYNPYASRVPSYPPQNLLDPHSTTNGGTLRSIKSMAANSIASTLLRSKKHAKAMSMAQLNQEKLMQQVPQASPQNLQPIPPIFLPNLASRAILNGSQTMKPISSNSVARSNGIQPNFETMTSKEMKKLLKKSAKYGLEPAKPPILPYPGPPSIRPMIPICLPTNQHNKSGTMMTSTSMFSDIYGIQPPPPPPIIRGMPLVPGSNGTMHHDPRTHMPTSPDQGQIKQILVKPTSEFLKSKAGKKWLKQQKQFKKLLPPHLDGLPIVFGPPPVEALEAANIPGLGAHHGNIPVSHLIGPHSQGGLPMMDSSGYYNTNGYIQQPGQNGRASAASTMLRYSPQYSQPNHDPPNSGDMMISDMIYHQHQNQQQNTLTHQLQQQMQPIMYNIHHQQRSQPPSIINGNNVRELMVDEGSSIPSSEILQHQRHFSSQRFMPQQLQKQRNHMVEQSVISLGDENDYEDEEDAQDHYSTPHQARQNSIDELGLFF